MPSKQPTLGNPALQMAAMELARKRAEKAAQKREQEEIEANSGLSPAIRAGERSGEAARTVKWVAAGIGGGILLILLGRTVYKATVRQNFFDKSDDQENAEHYIKQFEAAFSPDTWFGWGTDEELLRDIVVAVPHLALWEEIKGKWRTTHKTSLLSDIQNEVSRHMQNEIDAIISQKPKNKREADKRGPGYYDDQILSAHARRVYAATQYEYLPGLIGGTDSPAIFAVLRELPSFAALCRLNWIYRDRYGISMMEHLWDELSWGEIDEVQQLIKDEYPDARNQEITELFLRCTRPADL